MLGELARAELDEAAAALVVLEADLRGLGHSLSIASPADRRSATQPTVERPDHLEEHARRVDERLRALEAAAAVRAAPWAVPTPGSTRRSSPPLDQDGESTPRPRGRRVVDPPPTTR